MQMTSSARARNKSLLTTIGLAAGVAGIIAVAHSFYVSLFAGSLPYWDQWDQLHAELVPWWQGRGSLQFLFAAHNEHRIFFTRLVSMALLALNNGHWSNLVETYANTLIYGGVLASFFVFAAWDLKSALMRILLLLFIVGMGCLPFDWENTLVGFQSPFYFMLGTAVLLTACAAYAEDTRLRSLTMLILGIASLFTMASGLLAPLAGVAVLAMRGLPTRTWSVRTILTAGGLFATAVAGLLLLPHVPGDISLQANGIKEHARGMLLVLMWPLVNTQGVRPLFALLLWLPACISVRRVLLGHRVMHGELFLLGIAGWMVLQAFAISHARGHDLVAISSRYTSIVVVGVFANLALGMLWASDRNQSTAQRTGASAWLVLMLPMVCWIMAHRTPGDIVAMTERGTYSEIEANNVSRFMATGEERFLQHPGQEIPYPVASVLQHYLAEPALRGMLTTTIGPEEGTAGFPADSGRLTRLAEALRRFERAALLSIGISRSSPSFQPIAFAAGANGLCTVDALNGNKPAASVTMQQSNPLTMQGWLIRPKDGLAAKDALVLLGQSKYRIDLSTTEDRPDVVKALHSDPSLTRGFTLLGTLYNVTPGTYTMAIARSSAQSLAIYCKLPITFSVVQ